MNTQSFFKPAPNLVAANRWQPPQRSPYFAVTPRSKWNGYLMTTLAKAAYRS